jgi:hypothetical protein
LVEVVGVVGVVGAVGAPGAGTVDEEGCGWL